MSSLFAGNILISSIEVTSVSNHQLAVTSISTGGPATTVTWTRDSSTVTQGTQTVLNDPVTAQYTHTLTVTTSGDYTCTVSNHQSSDSASIIVEGIINIQHHFKAVMSICSFSCLTTY